MKKGILTDHQTSTQSTSTFLLKDKMLEYDAWDMQWSTGIVEIRRECSLHMIAFAGTYIYTLQFEP